MPPSDWFDLWSSAMGFALGVLALAGTMWRPVRKFLRRIDSIEHELHPNSGLALRDAVDRTEKAVGELSKTAAVLVEVVKRQGYEIRDLKDADQQQQAQYVDLLKHNR